MLPTFRRPRFLKRAIDSVQNQSVTDWELILVDDNPDGTIDQRETHELLSQYSADPRIRYLPHGSNRGGSAARNTGIRAAKGKYVAFLDDDDEWRAGKLERQLDSLRTGDGQAVVSYTGYTLVRWQRGEETRSDVRPRHDGQLLARLLERNVVGTTSTVMCEREALYRVGLFDERLPASQDHDLYIRLAFEHSFACLPEPLVISYRHEEGRITTDVDARVRGWELLYHKHEAVYAKHPRARASYQRLVVRNYVRRGLWDRMKGPLTEARRFRPLDPEYLAYALLPGASDALIRLVRSSRELGRKAKARASK